MWNENFPMGADALHPDWPEARFNISGMFTHHGLILDFMRLLQQSLSCRAPIGSLHGAPAVMWNAGRPSKVPCTAAQARAILDSMYAMELGWFATFNNHLIEETDLTDPACNELLECLAQRPDLNGVIVSSDRLAQYIARKHPLLRQIASVTKVSIEKGRGRVEYYRELGQRFWRYVVHPDDCRDLELMAQLDPQKAEILVNENCATNCPNRAIHYDIYARWQKAACAEWQGVGAEARRAAEQRQLIEVELKQIVASCRSPFHLNRLPERHESCNLTRRELKALYDLGFRYFKLQGRADDLPSYLYDLVRFLLEPDFAGPLMQKALGRNIRVVR